MSQRSSSGSTQAVWVCITLTLITQIALTHPPEKRQISFFHLECQGQYNKSVFARLDRICEDCYNLFREPEVHTLCRTNCFTTNYFKGCLDALQLSDEADIYQYMIRILHGVKPPGA